jgi:hypothetical protein
MTDPSAILAQARQHEDARQWAQALALVAPLAAALREGPAVLAAIEATWAQARSTAQLGRGDESLTHAKWALETASDPRHRAIMWPREVIVRIDTAFRDWCAALHGCGSVELADAVALARPALAFLDQAGCGQWHGGVFAALGNIAFARSAHANAIGLYRSALECKRSYPDTPGLGLAAILANLSRMYDWSGQLDAAVEVLHELMALPGATPDQRHGGCCLLAATAQRRGAFEEALRWSSEGVAMAEAIDPRMVLVSYAQAIEARLALRDGAGARVDAERALELAVGVGRRSRFDASLQAIDVALFNGELARATDLLVGLDEIADHFDRDKAAKPLRTKLEEHRALIAAAGRG